MDSLTLTVEGSSLDPLALADSIVSITRMINSLTQEKAPDLEIGELRSGSAILGVKGPDREMSILNEGLGSLKGSNDIPDGWTTTTLDSLINFRGTLRRRGVEGVTVSIGDTKSALDEKLLLNAERAKENMPLSLGSIRGRLYRYSNPSNRPATASIEDRRSRDAISVEIPADEADAAANLIEKEVRVWGIVTREPISHRIVSIRLRGIEPSRGHSGRPISSYRGAIDVAGEDRFDSVEAVRRLRES